MGFPSLAGVTPTYGNDFDVIERGTYLVAITDYKFKSGKNGWEGIRFEFTIQSGKYAKRKLWHQFTVAHDKKEPAERGRAELAGMLTAAGHPNPANPDSAPIKGLQLGAKVRIQKNKERGEEENAISKWLPKASLPADVLAGAPAAAPTQTSLGFALTSLGAAQTPPETPPMSTSDAKLNDEIPF